MKIALGKIHGGCIDGGSKLTVYNDMASDAGYAYGTEGNQQMAAMLEYQEQEAAYAEMQKEAEIEEEYQRRREILFRRFNLKPERF